MTACVSTIDDATFIPWINTIFGECVYGIQHASSIIFGYLSIICWLNAQLPQVIKNYKIGSASSLSICFLIIWFTGDSANLIGALLTHQLPFQMYLGIYFVFIDTCLLFQWIYYNRQKSDTKEAYSIIPNPEAKNQTNLIRQPASHSLVKINTAMVPDELTPLSSSTSPCKWYSTTSKGKSKNLMSVLMFSTTLLQSSLSPLFYSTIQVDKDISILTPYNIALIGRAFAWMCTSFYLFSRIPQLIKNYRSQSMEGLSISLFVFAALGNLTYFSSIVLHPGHTHDSLLDALPYLIGSAGTLLFDFAIFSQFLRYRKSNKKIEIV